MEPLSLREVQRWMKSRIRPDGAQRMSRAPSLNRQRGVAGEARLAVYVEGYLTRAQEALTEVYEAVHHALGDRTFVELSRAYAYRHPSHDYNLSLLGRHLPEFLVTSPLTARLPFLPDLAALEWRVAQAFHAFDAPPLDPRELAVRSLDDWQAAHLIFQPSVAVVVSAWPILDIWEARTRPMSEINIDVVNRPQDVLVSRQEWQVRCRLLERPACELLGTLLARQPLGLACAALAQRYPGHVLPVTTWFTQWVHDGLVVRCEAAATSRAT